MLKGIIKWSAALLGALLCVAGILYYKAESHFKKTADLVLEEPKLTLEIAAKPEWIQEGARIAAMKGCFDCHGSNLAGKIFAQDPAVGTFAGANLTKGQGGIGGTYSDADWVRSIRFGRGVNKKYLKFMPSQEYAAMTDEDLGKLIAYLKSIPAVDQANIPIEVGPMAKMLYMGGKMPLLFSGENVDPKMQAVVSLQPSESAEYGKYLAASCVGCHHPNYGGGAIPGVPPSWPKAANLTPKGAFATWSYEDFKTLSQTGKTPGGKALNPQYMPWPAMMAMNDVELKALYNFLKSLPAASEN